MSVCKLLCGQYPWKRFWGLLEIRELCYRYRLLLYASTADSDYDETIGMRENFTDKSYVQ